MLKRLSDRRVATDAKRCLDMSSNYREGTINLPTEISQENGSQDLTNETTGPALEGESAGWWDNNAQAFFVSLLFHVVLILSLAVVPTIVVVPDVLSFRVATAEQEDEFTLIEHLAVAEDSLTEVGANSSNDAGMALSMAPLLAELSEIPSPSFDPPTVNATYDLSNPIPQAMGLVRSEHVVKGMTGVGTTGTDGAIDRITYEILRSMEERPTLAVWFFDQSGSLQKRRQEIRDRFDRIYEELGIVERTQEDEQVRSTGEDPLLTSMFAFGQQVSLLLPKPTADIEKIRAAIDGIQQDDSGIERVFTALYKAVGEFKSYRSSRGHRAARNVLFIAVTDERGDDDVGLDATIKECQKYAIPVYVIGVPAAFGRDITYIKYVDPDPKYDQTPQWAQVDQGPESVRPERIRLGYKEDYYNEPVIDSGFGPYALSRLTYETGGIYFTVHPNRRLGSRVRRGEIDPFASNLEYFFDPEVMAKYQPDYVSAAEYMQRVSQSPLRQILVSAAEMPRVDTLINPKVRFVKRDEAALANELTQAQQQSARLGPDLQHLADYLKTGEAHRDKEISPRWIAGFDLSLGTVLAHKVRNESYNALLAKGKRGMKFEAERNNTWLLVPANKVSVSSRLEKEGSHARDILSSVASEHQGTPWGLLASEELRNPIGWKWTETYTDLNPSPPRTGANNNPPRPPSDDQARMLAPQAPKRPIPKL